MGSTSSFVSVSVSLSVWEQPLKNPPSSLFPLSLHRRLILSEKTFPKKTKKQNPFAAFTTLSEHTARSSWRSMVGSETFSCLRAITSTSVSLSYSFLCTWPWLFPHRHSFPRPPLWQLHINHSHIPRKTASSCSILPTPLTPHPAFHTCFLSSHQISKHARATLHPPSQSCHFDDYFAKRKEKKKIWHLLQRHSQGSDHTGVKAPSCCECSWYEQKINPLKNFSCSLIGWQVRNKEWGIME